jgi:hypothetical protein
MELFALKIPFSYSNNMKNGIFFKIENMILIRVLITMAVFLMKLAVNNLAVFLIKWQ